MTAPQVTAQVTRTPPTVFRTLHALPAVSGEHGHVATAARLDVRRGARCDDVEGIFDYE